MTSEFDEGGFDEVQFADGDAAGGDDGVAFGEGLGEGGFGGGRVVGDERVGFGAGAGGLGERGEGDAVALVDLAGKKGLAGFAEFVAGGEEAEDGLRVNAHGGDAGGGEKAQLRGGQRGADVSERGLLFDIFGAKTNVLPGGGRRGENGAGGVGGIELDVFLHDDGVGAGREHGASEDAGAGAGRQRGLGRGAGGRRLMMGSATGASGDAAARSEARTA